MTTVTTGRTQRSEAGGEEPAGRHRPWWTPWVVAAVVAVAVVAIGSYLVYGRGFGVASMADGGHVVPTVTGYYQGDEILFLHTEASDPGVAAMLTGMMGSPVVEVPSLADVPDDALAPVYVFTNGVEPGDADERGPFGHQADVFDAVPGDSAYRPLRAVHLVTWADDAQPRLLRSVDEIAAAAARGQLAIDPTGTVVNMPIVAWPGGTR